MYGIRDLNELFLVVGSKSLFMLIQNETAEVRQLLICRQTRQVTCIIKKSRSL
jgi:hypothetical protein